MSSDPKNSLLAEIDYERPWMYEKQEDGIFCDTRYAAIEASTKAGKTIGCLIWLLEKAITKPGDRRRYYWWVAPVSKQASIAFERLKELLHESLGEPGPDGLWDKNESEKYIHLKNNARIEFKSGDKPDSLYGEDVYGAVIDEASRCKEGVWTSVRSTLTHTRGPIRIIGNVKGRNNWFYRKARAAQSGKKNWTYTKITALDAVNAGVYPLEELLDAKANNTEQDFLQLYMAEPPDDGGNPFGIDHIRYIATEHVEKNNPTVSNQHPVAWGWDVAKAHNWTVGIGLDRDGDVCRFYRWRDTWPSTARRIKEHVGPRNAYLDATGIGDSLMDLLYESGMAKEQVKGFVFTPRSKQELMTKLAMAIQNHEIRIPEETPIVTELEAFQYETRRNYTLYAAPEGVHDDCVDALALAVKMWKEKTRMPDDAAPTGFTKKSYWRK